MKGERSVTGKRGEYSVIARLMENGLSVYIPVVDIEGIDCIVRNDKERLIEIQIKTRTKNGIEGRHFRVKNLKPHQDFFICCYHIDTNELWVVPSYLYNKLAITDKEGVKVLPMSRNNQIKLAKYKDNLGINLLKLKEFK